MASPSVAANAYASLARIIDSGGGATGAGKASEGGRMSFGALLKETLGNVMEAGK